VPGYAEAHPDFPFVVVAPRTEQDWNVGFLALVLEDARQQYSIDENRIYLTGLSTGGQATWELGVALPDLFAALAPVAAEGNALGINLCNIAHVPVRAFHNENDPVYPIWQTRDMIDTLNACGGNAQLTAYPSGEHDAWTETYNSPELYDWFLAN
jgi:predicted peptidase